MSKEDISSPCIGVCKLDKNNVCVGCKRTIEEIENWNKYTNDEKINVWKRLLLKEK